MQKLWLLLNNRKTTIGAGLLFVAMVLQQFSSIWMDGIPPEWVDKTILSLEWLGGIFTGVGLGHKGVKTLTSKSA